MSEIRKAMVAAIADMSNPAKNSRNPHFRNTYADLVAVLGVIRPALAEHGLAVTQCVATVDGELVLQTTLHHEGGDQMSLGVYPIRPVKADPQGVGSALTYARRYSLMAAFGLGAEDDDGHAASRPVSTSTPPAARVRPAPAPKPAASPTVSKPDAADRYADWVSEINKCESVDQVHSLAQSIKADVDSGAFDDEQVAGLRGSLQKAAERLSA